MELSRATKCIWWCMIMLFMASFFIHPIVGFNIVTFEFYETKYSDFITQVQNQLASSEKTCGILATPSNPAKVVRFVWVKLKTDSKEVTLGINVTNAYILGYQDIHDGKIRANLFGDTPAADAKELFANAAITRTFSFSGSYSDLERPSISGTNRATIELTFEGLHGDVEALAGQSSVQNKVASKFFLRATQFVSEAIRFKFIEAAIENQAITPEFRNKMISYENVWDVISQEVHTAASNTNCGHFTKPITVNGHKLENVMDVKEDMGLIKHKTTKKAASSFTP